VYIHLRNRKTEVAINFFFIQVDINLMLQAEFIQTCRTVAKE